MSEGAFHFKYKVGLCLGSGAFAQVFACTSRGGQKYAVKVLDQCTMDVIDKRKVRATMWEVEILQRVRSFSACVRLADAFVVGSCSYIVMERCDSTLYGHLDAQPRLTEKWLAQCFQQMLLGVSQIHSVGIVHRDIKPDNFLVKGGVPKLCDFGLSAVLHKDELLLEGVVGTAPYMSPEMLAEDDYDEKTDLWSFGVVAYVLLLGKFPYFPKSGRVTADAVKASISDAKDLPDYRPAAVSMPPPSDALAGIVRSLLARRPEERATVREASTKLERARKSLNSSTSLRAALYEAKQVGAFSVGSHLTTFLGGSHLEARIQRLQSQYHGKAVARGVSSPSALRAVLPDMGSP